ASDRSPASRAYRAGCVMQVKRKKTDGMLMRLVQRIRLPAAPDDLDWAGDADWARLQQEPVRARTLLRLGVLVFVVLLVWAAFAELDEVTRGEGKVVPSSQLQIIQS